MRYHCTVTVRGEVQGVNLRSRIKFRASSLGLNGTVENRSDGTVLVEVEGNQVPRQEFLQWLKDRPAGLAITGVEAVWSSVRDQYSTFKIIG